MKQTYYRHGALLPLFTYCAVLGSAQIAMAQVGLNSTPRLAGAINERNMVALAGNMHPLAAAKFDTGSVPDSLRMDHMYLLLRRSPEQEQALDKLLADMQNRLSANYHNWLTADELGKSYGPAQSDIDAVISWLTLHGLQVNGVSKSGLVIDVSGTAGQVREAFHTEIHSYNVRGQSHIANATNPQVPAALAPLIVGFNSLNNFKPKPLVRKPNKAFSIPFGGGERYLESPADFARIYNSMPLYQPPFSITGKGQTVVVLEDSDINPADVATFRSVFGLSGYSGTFEQVHPGPGCVDPGTNAGEGEAALDAEWAGAVAPGATVLLASCADTVTTFGGFTAAQNLLDLPTPPPIMSLSLLNCEANLGPSGNLYIYFLWQQAALEGVSVFAAAGDGGPASCDDFNLSPDAVVGIGANGYASTPFNVATGGTDFLDTFEGEDSLYWSNSNGATGKSAKSYVPEMPWNDSCASLPIYEYFGYTDPLSFCNSTTGANFLNIVAGSGAPSFVWAKPYWQNVLGIPADGVRDLPDVSLFAANGLWRHAVLYCMSDPNQGGVPCDYTNPIDTFGNSAGGTSFSAPQFASIQALINQKAGGPQGNPATIYYDLARLQYGTPSAPTGLAHFCNATLGRAISPLCLFHDVTFGDNAVPCYGTNNCYGGIGINIGVLSTSDSVLNIAYPAHTGWDFATGLGSVNVTNIVLVWP